MSRKLQGLFAGLVFTFGVSVSQAAIIYDNGAPISPPCRESPFASVSDSTAVLAPEIADDFMLVAGSNIITDIHWWGAYRQIDAPESPDDFTIRIYADGGSGLPVETAAATFSVGSVDRTNTGIQIYSARIDQLTDLYKYDLILEPLVLTPDQIYWLSIQNTTADDVADWGWALSDVGSDNAALFIDFSGEGNPVWRRAPQDVRQAFYLTSVPEPTTLALMGLGLAGIGYRRHRSKIAA